MSVLRHKPFRNLWLAQTASVIGDRLILVALALYVTDLTGDASDVGLVLAAQTMPFVALLLIGGVWADRLPRAELMIATDIVRAGLHALLAVLVFTDTAEVWHLVVIGVVYGIAEAFFRPAYSGLLPRTVPEAEIQRAQAVTGISNNVAELAGPALAAALVLGAGAGWAFTLDAVTFLFSAVCLLGVRGVGSNPTRAERQTLWTELVEGFQHVRSRTWLWVTVAVFTLLVPLAYAPLLVLGPTIAEEAYDWTALFGIVLTLNGAGALIGALIGLRWRPRYPLRVGYVFLAAWPALLLAFSLGAPVAVVAVLAVFMGVGFALFDIWWATEMAERIPGEALSRVSSYDWMGSLVLLPLGYLLAGALAEPLGAETVVALGGAAAVLVIAAGASPRQVWMLRAREAAAEPAPSTAAGPGPGPGPGSGM